ncbi:MULTISPECIES: DNA topoisomerase IB [unclassified Phycicoccus]|uniref:DNA topoisomerase IB n=1 Tax=unclassified Phycicoccus TaxID=2637926 RepID=UPI000702D20A|nr:MULTISPECIES: DNA topoisomerase IB [unclassified Phycicoccus]KQU70822.1 DNA topoisomerase [Phycicoccus sp. Root101]KQZ89112.1 DNA topoisomerase [Phycicoccus sp. Root563]
MARLRTVSPASRGWTRRRAGKGFVYLDADGARLPAADVERIRALVIPPAWENVWICPVPNGHIQAVGSDAAGRRQYLYHPDWRIKRDAAKFDRVLGAAARLPAARKRVLADLALEGMPRGRASAVAVRLLDLGYFRIGSDAYTEDNGSFGLTTLERQHVTRKGDVIVFCFVGKSGIEHCIEIDDTAAMEALDRLRKRRSASRRLLAYQDAKRWSDLDATTVNAYLAELLGGEMTAKDFRTWHATVLAAVALRSSNEPGDTKTSRKRAIKAAVEEVASYLGNTPTIAKNSYIDPRVLDSYESGTTIDVDPSRFRSPERRQAAIEKAVLALLAPS